MSRGKIIVGLDIGSSFVRAVIAEDVSHDSVPRIIGVGSSPSSGLRKGAVIDIEEVSKSINEALSTAEKMSGVAVEKAFVSLGGTQIKIQSSKGVVAIGRADGEVAAEDIQRAIEAAQAVSIPLNQEIVHIIPKSYRLDDQEGIKDPLGMNGVRLEVDTLVIESQVNHMKNLNKCVYQSGVEIEGIVLAPLAAAKAVLTKKQKELGGVLVNIGGGTTCMAVYEEGDLVYTSILPVGSGHITNDIAIGLRTSIDLAEKIKVEYGTLLADEIGEDEELDLSKLDSQESGTVLLSHISEIIEARVEEVFTMVNNELRNIGKAGLLPAGVIISGGGAKLPGIVDMAKNILGLPAQIGYPVKLGGILDKVDDPDFAVSVGLVLWAREENAPGKIDSENGIVGSFSKNMGSAAGKVKKLMEKFLP